MRVIFLDRDGVINEYPGDKKYVNNWSEFKFISGSIEGIRKLSSGPFKLFVVSNQAGVAKGLYTKKDLDNIDRHMLDVLKKNKAFLSGIYYCLHHPLENCACRKPKTALLEKALSDFKIKPEESFFIGDSFYDMNTARNFKAKSILVLSGKEKIENRQNWEFEPDYVFTNLLLAADFLISRYG
ncbi:MAG: HAD family hydrolase [Candidatus Omnitrophica bacterium]|jgi:D-glycero-D-manno-heptose 1,7-bisphosphate phosphatase|nr:HAD family hydrolase [Candidatus Omnitrophota bacterium]